MAFGLTGPINFHELKYISGGLQTEAQATGLLDKHWVYVHMVKGSSLLARAAKNFFSEARESHAPHLLPLDAFSSRFPFRFDHFVAFFLPDFFLFSTRAKRESYRSHGILHLGSKISYFHWSQWEKTGIKVGKKCDFLAFQKASNLDFFKRSIGFKKKGIPESMGGVLFGFKLSRLITLSLSKNPISLSLSLSHIHRSTNHYHRIATQPHRQPSPSSSSPSIFHAHSPATPILFFTQSKVHSQQHPSSQKKIK